MAAAEHRPERMHKNGSKTGFPSPPIHKAIVSRDLKQLKKLLLSGDIQLHPVTKETPLHVAARTGAIECLRWLLDNNTNSPFDKDRDGSTPGHFSAAYGQLETLKVSRWVNVFLMGIQCYCSAVCKQHSNRLLINCRSC